MTQATFSLIPFPDSNIPEIQISGMIERKAPVLTLHYSVTGDIERILLPHVCSRPGRKDDLWKATCFEFFLALPNDPQYWEFNLSPSGDWNVYHMDTYRRVGFREETLIQWLPFSVRCEPDDIKVRLTLDLSPIIPTENEIRVGITSVIQTPDGQNTYWALAHPKSQADFHLRETFILTLPA
jgi:hypothetical protein